MRIGEQRAHLVVDHPPYVRCNARYPASTSPAGRPVARHRRTSIGRSAQHVAVLGRDLLRIAERRDAARNDGYLLHGIAVCAALCHERMPGFVMRDDTLLLLVHHAAPVLDARHRAVDHPGEIGHAYCRLAEFGRVQRGIVDHVCEIRTDETGLARRQFGKIDLLRKLHTFRMHGEDLFSSGQVRPVDRDVTVKAARPQQRQVEDLGPVGRGNSPGIGTLAYPSGSSRDAFTSRDAAANRLLRRCRGLKRRLKIACRSSPPTRASAMVHAPPPSASPVAGPNGQPVLRYSCRRAPMQSLMPTFEAGPSRRSACQSIRLSAYEV
ncbi:hypothetical protein BLA3211_07135 [Burkholderia aenigmatica]|uniref:Uncharacterized protein n=1 Tax=Burkholderia aenigmatica TaxID=2015348 RepID=A0A6J5JMX1_9BURK|nr:hypothetical protein BLA3211_07135 [Burkholderia aenigmatica]